MNPSMKNEVTDGGKGESEQIHGADFCPPPFRRVRLSPTGAVQKPRNVPVSCVCSLRRCFQMQSLRHVYPRRTPEMSGPQPRPVWAADKTLWTLTQKAPQGHLKRPRRYLLHILWLQKKKKSPLVSHFCSWQVQGQLRSCVCVITTVGVIISPNSSVNISWFDFALFVLVCDERAIGKQSSIIHLCSTGSSEFSGMAARRDGWYYRTDCCSTLFCVVVINFFFEAMRKHGI